MIKLKLMLLLFLLPGVNGFGQDTCANDKAQIFKKELLSIIDSVRKQSHDQNMEYEIFVARFYHLDKDKNDFSFTLGYIVNSNEFNLMDANYFLEIGKEVLIVRLSDSVFIKELSKIGVKKFDPFDHTEEIKIVQRLFPKDLGLISYDPFGLTFYSRGCNVKKTYHQSSSDISREVSIYDLYPTGEIEKVDLLKKNEKKSDKK
jgi:hypothetical protein